MYTRTYQAEDEKITVPEKYDGNAFREDRQCDTFQPQDISISQSTEKDSKFDNSQDDAQKTTETSAEFPENYEKKAEGDGLFASIFRGGHKASFLDNLPFIKNGKFDIGTEEILIVAVALFLLFSKSGDKECAIMLLLLLFVK